MPFLSTCRSQEISISSTSSPPEWHHSEYGDKLRSNPFAGTKSVDMTSPINFIRSFYEYYISHYLAMKPELEAELKALRDRYCTKAHYTAVL